MGAGEGTRRLYIAQEKKHPDLLRASRVERESLAGTRGVAPRTAHHTPRRLMKTETNQNTPSRKHSIFNVILPQDAVPPCAIPSTQFPRTFAVAQ